MVWCTPSRPGASPEAWDSPLHSCLTLAASLLALYQVHPVISQSVGSSKARPTVCVWVGEDRPICSSQVCSQAPDSSVGFTAARPPAGCLCELAQSRWKHTGPSAQAVAPHAQSCDPSQGKGSLGTVFGSLTSRDE